MSPRARPLLAPIAALAIACGSSVLQAGQSPKFSVRLSNAYIDAKSSSRKESLVSVAGLDASFAYYLTTRLALGLAYSVNFDFTEKEVPLHGGDLFARFYLLGLGTSTTSTSAWSTSYSRSTIGAYLSAFLSQRSYLPKPPIGTAATRERSEGFSVGASLGADFRLDSNLDLNLEVGGTLASFTPSSGTLEVKVYRFLLGVSYLF